MTTLIADEFNLTGDYAIPYGRDWELEFALVDDLAAAIDLTQYNFGFVAEIRRTDRDKTLVCTGAPVLAGAGDATLGLITVVWPKGGWAAEGEQDGSHTWDLYGITNSHTNRQLIYGVCDTVRTTSAASVTP